MESVAFELGLYVENGVLECTYAPTCEEMVTLLDALKVDTTVHSLYLIYMDVDLRCIDDVAAMVLADALRVNTTLHTLHLSSNRIGEAGALELTKVFAVNTSLQTLCLYDFAAGAALLESLKINTTLGTLRLVNTDIDATTWSEYLKHNTTLHTLSFDCNNIDDVAAISLADALKVNDTLRVFRLNANPLGDAGAMALSEALKVNIGLHTLFLTNNHIGEAGAMGLAHALTVNSTLQRLSVTCSKFGGVAVQAIADSLHHHNGSLISLDGVYFVSKNALLMRNRDGILNVHKSTAMAYKVFRLHLFIYRDMSRMLGQYLLATQGHICWVDELPPTNHHNLNPFATF